MVFNHHRRHNQKDGNGEETRTMEIRMKFRPRRVNKFDVEDKLETFEPVDLGMVKEDIPIVQELLPASTYNVISIGTRYVTSKILGRSGNKSRMLGFVGGNGNGHKANGGTIHNEERSRRYDSIVWGIVIKLYSSSFGERLGVLKLKLRSIYGEVPLGNSAFTTLVSTMTGGRIGRGSGRTREPTSRVGGRNGDQGGQGGDRGIGANGGDDEVPDFSTVITQQLQDLLPTIIAKVEMVVLKEFMAYNPKDYDGKGGAIFYTHWIKKMESVQDMSGCGANQKIGGLKAAVGMTWEDFKDLMRKEFYPNNEMQKLETEFWCHAMVGAGHAAYTDHFHELARLVPYLVTPENKRIERYIYGLALQIRAMVAAREPTTIQSDVLKAGMLTDEAIRNGSLKKNIEKRGNNGELSRKENVRDDNKRSRTGRVFATITNPVMKEYTGTAPKCTNCSFHYNPEILCRKCTNCNCLGLFARDCRAGPRMVTPVSTRNTTTARGACFECGGTDHYKAACPRLNRAPRPGGNRKDQLMVIEGGQGRGNNCN
ncbi:reverse transcriptase domain-containing protein [Tanacetum coccineum]